MQQTLQERDSKIIWHPYTQMKVWPEAIGIVKGEGIFLEDEYGNRYLDAVSSWWVNLHGHAHPYIAQKVSEQLTTLEHCIFAGFTHEPAVQLAERLLPLLPGSMSKIFYSDNGSTAVEVALKMAHQYWQNKGRRKNKIIALEGAYHGDTVGAMSVSARSIFTKQFDSWLFDVAFIPLPNDNNLPEVLSQLRDVLSGEDAAAIIVEPLIQGSAGMRMYSPAALEQIMSMCHEHDCLVIADEVMTGFGRTGTLFACDQLEKETPDIVTLSKGLTGGTVPLGVTACTDIIFNAFLGNDSSTTLYHGHSFTANPIACAASLASLDLLLDESTQAAIKMIAQRHIGKVSEWAEHPRVKEARSCGTILALEVKAGDGTHYLSSIRDYIYKFFLDRRVLLRPLGNIVYILPPYCITEEELDYVYAQISEMLDSL